MMSSLLQITSKCLSRVSVFYLFTILYARVLLCLNDERPNNREMCDCQIVGVAIHS